MSEAFSTPNDRSPFSSITELAFHVLTHLDKLNTKEEQDLFAEVAQLIPLTNCAIYGTVFSGALGYKEKHGYYPDPIQIQAEHELFSPSTCPYFSPNHVRELLERLKTDQLKRGLDQAVSQEDWRQVSRLVEAKVRLSTRPVMNISDIRGRYDEVKNHRAGLYCGSSVIDQTILGYGYGPPHIIAAPPSSFKTTFAISTLYDACYLHGYNFLFISLEIPERDVWFNFTSRHALTMGYDHITHSLLKKGLLKVDEGSHIDQEADLEAILDDFERVKPGEMEKQGRIFVLTPQHIDEFSPVYLDGLMAQYQRKCEELYEQGLIRRPVLDGIFLDYIQLLFSYRPPRTDADAYIKDMVRYFTNLGNTFEDRGAIVFLLSQMNRESRKRLRAEGGKEGTGKRSADLECFAEINVLEREAATATVLFADDYMKRSGQVLVQVVKNRNGEIMEYMFLEQVDPAHFKFGSDKPLYNAEAQEAATRSGMIPRGGQIGGGSPGDREIDAFA